MTKENKCVECKKTTKRFADCPIVRNTRAKKGGESLFSQLRLAAEGSSAQKVLKQFQCLIQTFQPAFSRSWKVQVKCIDNDHDT